MLCVGTSMSYFVTCMVNRVAALGNRVFVPLCIGLYTSYIVGSWVSSMELGAGEWSGMSVILVLALTRYAVA